MAAIGDVRQRRGNKPADATEEKNPVAAGAEEEMVEGAFKREADDDSLITDEAEATVVDDCDAGVDSVPPEEDHGRGRIPKGQKKLATVVGPKQQDDAPPPQVPPYETNRVKTLRCGRTRLVKSGAKPPPKPRGRGRRKSNVQRSSKNTSPTGDRQGSISNPGGASVGTSGEGGYNPPPFDP